MDLMLLLAILLFLSSLYVIRSKASNANLPPGPRALPFIGHFHLLKSPLARSLSHLSSKYGPIFSLRLGMKPVVVVSSPSLAQECFTKNDLPFASRPRLAVGKYLGYDYNTVVMAPYGAHWRTVRKIQTLELLSLKKVEMFAEVRYEEVSSLLRNLVESSDREAVVNMKDKINETIFSVIVKMVANKSYYGCDGVDNREDAKEFREAIDETFMLMGQLNLGDYIPSLGWLDLQGLIRLMKALHRKRDRILQGLVDEHRKLRSEGEIFMPDFVHMLLDMKEKDPEYFTDNLIKSVFVVMITAGTETTAGTLEWALALLLNHPEALHRAQTELDHHIGRERLVQESDLSKLEYLRAIINETLRLYPPGPTIHESTEKCTLAGYTVPKGTMLLVNSYCIHRDPDSWPEPLSFKPERFMGSGIDIKGHDFRMIPFGSGRRSCPGMGLALRSVEYVLASLLHGFEWRRESPELIDMTEGGGLSLPRMVPLRAIVTRRLSPHVYPIV